MKQPNEKAIAELERITKRSGGTLNPEDVVKYARSPSSPLHEYFEWNDTDAAHQHRLYQARSLLRVWVAELPQKPNTPVRVMVSLVNDRGTRGYRNLVDVMSDEGLRRELLEEAKRDMSFFRRKYALLESLAGVFEAMDAVQ